MKNRIVLATVLLGLAWLYSAIELGSPQANASVAGTVSRFDGSPVSQATVQLGRGQTFTATTDSAGRFSFESIPPGFHPVRIDTKDIPLNGASPPLIGDMSVAAGAQIQDLHLEFPRTGVIAGTVLNARGLPSVSQTVNLWARRYMNGGWYIASVSRPASTNDRGMFRIYGLNPGDYYVSAGRPPEPQTYFPGTLDASRATKVTLQDGEEAVASFQMQMGRSLALSAFVVRPENGQGLQFTLVPEDTPMGPLDYSGSVRNGSDPNARWLSLNGLNTGTYTVFARVLVGDQVYFGQSRFEPRDSSVDDRAITLTRAHDITGRFTIQDGSAPSNLSAEPILLRSQTKIPYERLLAAGGRGAPTPTANTDRTFVIRGVPEGLFAILPPGYGDVYIVDVLQAGTSVLNSGLTVGSETPAPLDVVLSTRGGTLTGVVENARSQGVGFKTVVLVPLANKPPAWYKTASTDYHGAFSMSNIAPGEYRVFAWGLVPDNAWFDPEFLKPFEDKGPRISVAADARVTGLRVPLIVP